MTKANDEDVENSFKCWICDHVYVEVHVKVKDHCHISENIEAPHMEIVILTLIKS